jgi:hypothetical protein
MSERHQKAAARLWQVAKRLRSHARNWQGAGNLCEHVAVRFDTMDDPPVDPPSPSDPCAGLLSLRNMLMELAAADQALLQAVNEEIETQGC